ncbi:MAG: DNA replication and repair protein RecF [Ignavibacteriales bacterium]|nr:DNA replication and repair protein RecF [Ignavibacteriales bacterium]
MNLKFLKLKNFRLHKNSSIEFSDNLNYILGGNGQGKTSILEAVYYISTTKSYIASSDYEAVSFSENFFDIDAEIRDLTENKIKLTYNALSNKKEISLNNKNVYSAASIIGQFPIVIITQSDYKITLGAPADRRKFIDSIISQASETYLNLLLEYQKTLRQRSSLLNQIKETNNSDLFKQLDVWTETLVSRGAEIVKHRLKFVKLFNEYITICYRKIMNDAEKPIIKYSFNNCEDEDKVESVFIEELQKLREQELRRATNLVGPHRDDFLFYVNDYELKSFGSQGQNKTYQIALKFGQFFFLKDVLGKTPIFLMDDVFGELDSFRAKKISEYLNDIGQAFITLTDFANFTHLNKSANDKIIKVAQGNVSYA